MRILLRVREPDTRSFSGLLSLLLHTVAIVGMLFVGRAVTERPGRTGVAFRSGKDVTPLTVYLPSSLKQMGGGGGGGDRSPLPAPPGRLPRLAQIQLTPPTVVIRNQNPKLPEEPTVIVAPNITIPQPALAQLGDPFSRFIGPPSNGPGSGGGIGRGNSGGVGPGEGPGVGSGKGGNFGGDVYRWGAGVSAPQLIYHIEPDYTEEARKARYQGTVLLNIVVGTDGRVRDAAIVRSLGLGLDEKALQAVRQWKFKPGTVNGQPVAVAASVAVSFRLL